MKATFDLPEELYRQVKARSALEGRPVKDVVIELFQNWLGKVPPSNKESAEVEFWEGFTPPLQHLVKSEHSDSSMTEIRESIIAGYNEKA